MTLEDTSTVDVHAHFVPRGLVDRVRAEGAAHGVGVVDGEGRAPAFAFAGRGPSKPLPGGITDIERRIAWMDDRAVDVQVVSPWMDLSAYSLDPDDGGWFARTVNDLTAEAVASRPDRFLAIASVPLQAPGAAASELRRAVSELGMVGVEIGTSVEGRELDDPALEPFWNEAEALDAPVLVHPLPFAGSARLRSRGLDNVVGYPAEETIAASFLLFGGVLDRHAHLRVCLTHGGGFLPYQVGRLDRALLGPSATPGPGTSASSRFFYDTVVHASEAVRFLVERVGAERVVLGSDHPFPMGDPDPVETVRRAGLDPEDERAILRRNAARMLGPVLAGGTARRALGV